MAKIITRTTEKNNKPTTRQTVLPPNKTIAPAKPTKSPDNRTIKTRQIKKVEKPSGKDSGQSKGLKVSKALRQTDIKIKHRNDKDKDTCSQTGSIQRSIRKRRPQKQSFVIQIPIKNGSKSRESRARTRSRKAEKKFNHDLETNKKKPEKKTTKNHDFTTEIPPKKTSSQTKKTSPLNGSKPSKGNISQRLTRSGNNTTPTALSTQPAKKPSKSPLRRVVDGQKQLKLAINKTAKPSSNQTEKKTKNAEVQESMNQKEPPKEINMEFLQPQSEEGKEAAIEINSASHSLNVKNPEAEKSQEVPSELQIPENNLQYLSARIESLYLADPTNCLDSDKTDNSKTDVFYLLDFENKDEQWTFKIMSRKHEVVSPTLSQVFYCQCHEFKTSRRTCAHFKFIVLTICRCEAILEQFQKNGKISELGFFRLNMSLKITLHCRSLPEKNPEANTANPSTCYICMDDLKQDQLTLSQCPECMRKFHSSCFKVWVDYKPHCPLCNSQLEEKKAEPEQMVLNLEDELTA